MREAGRDGADGPHSGGMALQTPEQPTAIVMAADVVRCPDGWRLLDRHGDLWNLPTLPRPVADALRRTDGTRSPSGLRSDLPVRLRPLWDELLSELLTAGLVPRTTPTGVLRVALLGSQRLATQLALALVEIDFLDLHVIDPRPPDLTIHRRGRHHTGADALRSLLIRHGADPERVRTGGHWAELSSVSPIDLVVVADDTVEVDRVVTDHLGGQGLPHLLVTGHRDRGAVGPHVTPGVGPCLGCLDRHRLDADPQWPSVAAKLGRHRADPSPAVLRWLAGTTQAFVTAIMADALADGMVTSLRLGDGLPTTQQWPPHQDCPCQAGPW